ncbi:hypothetical protein [Paenibacillus polymyxa]|uniref:Uncharacterized protein n=1 Tax=Paenibacillus polymyxa (strain SC2) TaxID=886882 RepID=E3EJU4_PAEPS|nr:hypothetical protein [Paenibacillus polymyxa]ADO59692.1 hypothetical protein PPSC2_26670 [Paenibacillus polymyxa SC2]WPQ59485.1 hypothetical protein SKN87_27875 [Paenibacillus polymyxa]
MKNVFDFDLNYDFREVRELMIKEKLSEEELMEGLEAEEVFVKVCITDHVYNRMNNSFGRQCNWEMIEDLILEKGHLLFELKFDEEFAMKNSDGTLALICKLYPHNGELVLILETVIRTVIIINGKEVDKQVKVYRSTKTI